MMNTLKTDSRITRNAADHLALNPTAIIPHAMRPKMETRVRAIDHWPCRMKPIKRKIKRTRPTSWKLYIRM